MPRKGKKDAPSTRNSSSDVVTWSNVRLANDDAEGIINYATKPGDVIGDAFAIVYDGGTVTLKTASDGASYMAIVIVPDKDNPGNATGISGFADTPFDALACVLYKWLVSLGGTHPTSATDGDKPKFR